MHWYRPGKHPLLFLLTVFLGACQPEPDYTALEGMTMGTTWSVTISARLPDRDRRALLNDIQTRLDEIEGTMSTYMKDSELSRVNRTHETDWIDISEDLYTVITGAMEISHLTGGAFDITIGPVVNLWGFGPDEREDTVPSAEAIQALLDKTGYSKLKLGLSPPSIRKTEPELYLDLSGIAKGYGVDEIGALLESKNIHNYLVDIGGEILAGGKNPEGTAWRIGIEKPLPGERSVQQTVSIRNTALATSGDYRNYFEEDGVRYSHTIDPRTGYPVRHNLASVTVLHESAMTADTLATALLVMGATEGLKFAARDRLPAYFIINTGDAFIERHTEPFRRYLEPGDND